MDNIKDLYLEAEVFEDARQKFNMVLQRLFKSMADTNSSDGSITLKMDVNMKRELIPNNDPEIKGSTREIMLPDFGYKVSSTISVKEEEKGNNNPQMELVWNEEQQKFVLQYVANTTQRSIFDSDFQENMSGKKAGDGQDGIETSTERDYLAVAQIAGPVEDQNTDNGSGETDNADSQDIVDGDFRELGEDADGRETEDSTDESQGDTSSGVSEEEEQPGEDAGRVDPAEADSYEDGEENQEDDGYEYEDPEDPEE